MRPPPDSGKTVTPSSRYDARHHPQQQQRRHSRSASPHSRSHSPRSVSPEAELELDAEDDGEDELDADEDVEVGVEGRERDGPGAEDYDSGLVSCDACGVRVPFRDPKTGQFTLKLWDAHRDAWCVPSLITVCIDYMLIE